MNIAHIIPHSITFPLEQPNGRYNWVLQLAQLQARQGHEVTVYCHPKSYIEGLRTAGIKEATEDNQVNNEATFSLALQNDHDIYHSHFDSLHYKMARHTAKPIIFTQHWWPNELVVELAKENPGNVWAVPPTKYMYDFNKASGIQTSRHIHHGIDLELFKPQDVKQNNRLLFVGRISPEKNLDVAISVARRSGYGLDVIGKIPPKYQSLWDEVRLSIDGTTIRYLDTVPHSEMAGYYSRARAVLFPSDINEAFGLVAIEAQACGTPVLMKRGGSRSELVVDRTTGFLCESEEDFITAIHKVDTLSNSDCVEFAKSFSIEKMHESYIDLYKQLAD